jgi:hypothetical protein
MDRANDRLEWENNPLKSMANQFKETWHHAFGGSGQGRARKAKAQPKDEHTHAHTVIEDKRSAIEKMRDKVAEMDEDYKDAGERVLGFFVQLVGYLGPFLLMAWVGSDLGKYFAPVMDPLPAYGLSYTIEGIIAACTVSMGRGFAEIASGAAIMAK